MKQITNIFICLSFALTTNFLCTNSVMAQTTDDQQAPNNKENVEVISYEDLAEKYNPQAFDKDTVYNEEAD